MISLGFSRSFRSFQNVRLPAIPKKASFFVPSPRLPGDVVAALAGGDRPLLLRTLDIEPERLWLEDPGLKGR